MNYKADDGDLTPKPHILKSIRSRSWTLPGAIQELVDNSLGHGNARNITIKVDNKYGVMVEDDGVGIDNINRIFRLGDSTGYGDLANIGQYGVGATHAAIWIGDELSVVTVRDGLKHGHSVNWAKVDQSGSFRGHGYKGAGRKTSEPTGTKVGITDLARICRKETATELERELGRVFAAALRSGVKMNIQHWMTNDDEPTVTEVKPFTPTNMTREIEISGAVETKDGKLLPWSGRAGLSDDLTDKHNGVHISFGHRVIEVTREPFGGKSVPTLYCEVYLDSSAPWKYALSDHKDRVTKHRDALMTGIKDQLEPILEQAAQMARTLALRNLTIPIEAALTKALRGMGDLHLDEDETPEGGAHGESETPTVEAGNEQQRDAKPEGEPAKPAGKPGGISIEYRNKSWLSDKLYTWEISGRQFVLYLDEDVHASSLGWPPSVQTQHVTQLICSYLSSAITTERGNPMLFRSLGSGLQERAVEWSDHEFTAMLNRELLDAVVIPTGKK